MMHVTRFALAVATTACLFTLAIGSSTSAASTGGPAATTEAANSSSSSSVTNATTVTPQTSTASASSNAPTASPVTDGGASSALSTGSTPASGGAAGSSPTPATTTAAPTSTTPKPVCYSQTCTTGGATCTNETGAVCDKGTGQCFQTTRSNSTFKQVVTGCENTCEALTSTAQTGFTEVHLCCNTDKCNLNLQPSGSSSMTTASVLLALTSVLLYALI